MSKLLNAALTQYGVKEITGRDHNPEITKYFDLMGFNGDQLGDETAWCAAVMNYLCLTVMLPTTGTLNARAWLDVGIPVSSPKAGDVVIFWRGSHKDETITGSHLKKGHVGIFINQIGNEIYCLGGNQSNQFCISPQDGNKLLGYRRLEF